MADDWKPGDLALCVRGGQLEPDLEPLPAYPRAGVPYTVSVVEHVWLWLRDGPLNADGSTAWQARRFIKVTPPEADEFDREVIELMKPVKVSQ